MTQLKKKNAVIWSTKSEQAHSLLNWRFKVNIERKAPNLYVLLNSNFHMHIWNGCVIASQFLITGTPCDFDTSGVAGWLSDWVFQQGLIWAQRADMAELQVGLWEICSSKTVWFEPCSVFKLEGVSLHFLRAECHSHHRWAGSWMVNPSKLLVDPQYNSFLGMPKWIRLLSNSFH